MRKLIFLMTFFLTACASVSMAARVTEEDKNNDKKPDFWIYYGDNDRPEKMESDRNYDGKLDLWIIYEPKGKRRTEIDLNYDGKPDMFSYFEYGQRVKFEIDSD